MHPPDGPPDDAAAHPSGPPDGRDALRVQAAAVAAQQAELAEEEARLRQRAAALEKQEEQLAAHLEERQRRLRELQERVRRDRDELKADEARARERRDALEAELRQARSEAEAAGQQAHQERRRLGELRRRLKRRWRRHWQAHEAALARREHEALAERRRLRQDAEALRKERAALTQAQLRFNGEAELGRRELQEGWEELSLAQQQWEACLNREKAEREQHARRLEARAAELVEVERALRGRQEQWQERQAALQREIEGLQSRVRNQRQKLLEAAAQSPRPEPAPAPNPAAPGARALPARLPAGEAGDLAAVLRRLAGDLADQRLHLLEQWQELLNVQALWHRERQALLAELEGSARRLDDRERRVAVQEHALASAAASLRQRQEAASQVRCALEGWQARLTAREAGLEGEREKLLADVKAREEAAAAELARLTDLRKRWAERRRQELEEVRAARRRAEEVRRYYVGLWQECQARRAAIAREQRDLAARTLALEQVRLDLPGRAPDAAAAERRIERLRRRFAARVEAEQCDLIRERQALQAETARLAEEGRRQQEREAGLASAREELDRRAAEGEDGRAEAQADVERARLELLRLRALRECDERQLAALRDEVERIARHLIDEEAPAPPAASQAA
jgi:hypothetical protein